MLFHSAIQSRSIPGSDLVSQANRLYAAKASMLTMEVIGLETGVGNHWINFEPWFRNCLTLSCVLCF